MDGQFLIENIPEGNYILKAIHYEFDDEPLYVVEIFKDSTVEIKINGPKPCKHDGISKRCPSCKKRNKVIPIIYGLPSAKLYQNAKKVKVISDYDYMLVGQAFIDKDYRGQGLIENCFHEYKEAFVERYDFSITEIAKSNIRSLKAHRKVGFEEIHSYTDNDGTEWSIVVWDWRNNEEE